MAHLCWVKMRQMLRYSLFLPVRCGKYGGNSVLGDVAFINDSNRRGLEVFHRRVRHIGAMIVRNTSSGAFDILHQSIQIITRWGDADDTNRSAVPQLRGVKFGDGNVEARPQTVFQTAHDLPPVFEGLRCFDMEFEGKESDGHAVVSGQ